MPYGFLFPSSIWRLFLALSLVTGGAALVAAKDFVSSATEISGSALMALALVALGEGSTLMIFYLRNAERSQDGAHPGGSGCENLEQAQGRSPNKLRSKEVFADTSLRLHREIESLTRRASLNLGLGILISFIGAGILFYLAFSLNAVATNLSSYLPIFLPRLATALFLEVFAFFFLRLYKTSLAEIKYYQNELTDLALREIALEVVSEAEDANLKALLTEQFVKPIRNPSSGAVGRSASNSSGDPEALGVLREQAVRLIEAMRKSG